MSRSRLRHLAAMALATVAAATFAAGCSSNTPPTSVTVPKGGFANDKSDPATYHWFTSHSTVVSQLGSLPTIDTTSGAPNYSAMSAACLAFGDSLATAKKLPAIPNSGAEALWKGALAQFAAAVTDCSRGVVNTSTTLLADAETQFTAGHGTIATLIFGPPAKSGA